MKFFDDLLLADWIDCIFGISLSFMLCMFGVSALIWALSMW